MSLVIISALLRMLREDEKADKAKQEEKKMVEEPPTWRQLFIKIIALSITGFIGIMFLGVMNYVMQLVS